MSKICHVKRFFLCKNLIEREVEFMFSDEVREKIIAKKELQNLDLVTLSLVMHSIEEVLEETEYDKQSLSDNAYDE